MNLKNFLKLLLLIAFFSITLNARASSDLNLTIRDGGTIIFSGPVPLEPAGDITLSGHSLNADSVLSVINDADISSSDFNISDLQYYDSFGSYYLKCITSSAGNDCDNWQYTINDIYPGIGMDKKILSGGENIYLYFGPQYKVSLSSNNILSTDPLTVTSQEYDYKTNSWKTRTGVTVGITKTNPSDPYNPTEVKTQSVDGSGKATFSEIEAGSYNIGIKEDSYFPTETLTVSLPPPQGVEGLASFSEAKPSKNKFDEEKAFNFLISQQKDDGSFGEDLYTDWTAISLSSNSKFQGQKDKLTKYITGLKDDKSYQLTDYERHSMALMSLGINPYNVNGINYIDKIISNFDGKQFGSEKEDNDDIFALIVLKNAGYDIKENLIKDDLDFILSRQKDNGSWDNSVDMTGAAIEVISSFNKDGQFKTALEKAKSYLSQIQDDNGGWNNDTSSTAWAVEGIIALGEKPEDWVKNDNNPYDFFASNQGGDGSIKDDTLSNKIWKTSYALSSFSGKIWNEIIQNFTKPQKENNDSIEKPNDQIELQNSNKAEIVEKPSPQIKNTNLNNSKKVKKVKRIPVIRKVEYPQNNIDKLDTSDIKIETNVQNKGWFESFLNKIFNFF